MALIALDHVSKIYAKGTRPALDDVTVHIDRGDFVFLVGASGSGKTTLLSLLLHEEEATAGELRVAGNDLRRMSSRQVPQYRRSIGFIFQDYKLLNNKTVWQNIAFALEVIGTSRSAMKSLVPKVLETVGLTGKEKNYPYELSGGEAQRVAIARAYVNHPQILLADEPTGNLDPTTSLGIMEVLDAINRTGTTIVMATHNEEIVNSMRKRVVELHNGSVVRDQRHGSYDSALFFPDADVESKAQRVLDNTVPDNTVSDNTVSDNTVLPSTATSVSAQLPVTAARPAHADGADGVDGADGLGGAGGADGANGASSVQKTSVDRQADNHGPDDSNDGERRSDVSTIHAFDAVVQVMQSSTEGDDGIARLANSVHSGRTGRYGDVFQSAEETMTWGKGIAAVADGQSESVDRPELAEPAEPADKSESADESESDDKSERADKSVSAGESGPVAGPPSPPIPPAPPQSAQEHHHRDQSGDETQSAPDSDEHGNGNDDEGVH